VKPNKVLVVDDSKVLHKMYGVMLSAFPVVVHAFNGVHALQVLGEHPDVDLILLDINMPEMNGLSLIAYLQKSPALAAKPVVIVSTEGGSADVQRGLDAGAKAYLRKPFRDGELLELIEKLEPLG
jgi:CheY-like chemotaxis protein